MAGITRYQRFYRNHTDKRKEASVSYYRELRSKVIDLMGGKCKRCGFTDKRALQIDHIKHCGANRALNNKRFLMEVIASFESGENKYQILCANCNWIKKSENHEIATKGVR